MGVTGQQVGLMSAAASDVLESYSRIFVARLASLSDLYATENRGWPPLNETILSPMVTIAIVQPLIATLEAVPPRSGTTFTVRFIRTLVPNIFTFKHEAVPPKNGTALATITVKLVRPLVPVRSYRWTMPIPFMFTVYISPVVHEAVPPNNGTTTVTVLYKLLVTTVLVTYEVMPPNNGMTRIMIVYYIMIIIVPIGQIKKAE